jgi:hypothetical protein
MHFHNKLHSLDMANVVACLVLKGFKNYFQNLDILIMIFTALA